MILEALATRRLTQLVVEDEITRPVRDIVTRWADRHREGTLPDRLGYLVDCPACASVWCGAAIMLMRRHRVGRWVVGLLALSGASLIIQAVTDAQEEMHS